MRNIKASAVKMDLCNLHIGRFIFIVPAEMELKWKKINL